MPELDQLLKQHVDDNTPDEVPDFHVVLERANREHPGRTSVTRARDGALAGPRAVPRGRRLLLVAAAAAAVVGGTLGSMELLGNDSGPTPVAQPPVVDPAPTQEPTEPVPSDDPVTVPEDPPVEEPPVEEPVGHSGPLPEDGQASCALEPTGENLAQRAFAFDGTVTAIDESTAVIDDGDDLGYAQVTFDVNEWYTGGEDPHVVIQMTPPVELTTDVTAEAGPSYEAGTRLLVSGEPLWGGDDPLADAVGWGCGFTVYWDADTAQTWDDLFGG